MDEVDKYLKDPKFLKWIFNADQRTEEYWNEWKIKNPDKKEEIERAKNLCKSFRFKDFEVSEEDKVQDWKKIQRGIRHTNNLRTLSFSTYYRIAVAAVFLILASIIFFVTVNDKTPETDQVAVSYLQKEAKLGQKLTIKLSDGTLVKLNSGSKIIFPSEFSSSSREVRLIGEGYFQVQKDVSRPFMVFSENVCTKVLGTSFNVNSYDIDNIQVTLVEGVVEVISEINGIIEKQQLTSGEKATWETNFFKVERVTHSRDISWKDETLVFHHDNIDEIKTKLERWYGVNITINKPEKILRSFVGEFKKETLVMVLESIGYALRFDYQINDTSVTINPIEQDD
jgi:transmembrane sensor